MTSKLSKYILTEFLHPLLVSYGALSVLILVAELMERLDRFIDGKVDFLVILQYLLAVLPIRGVEILPIAGLLGTLFALGNLSRRREITAAMSGGIHPWTMITPMLLCGLILCAFSWGLSDWVVPRASQFAQTLWNTKVRHITRWDQTQFDQLVMAGEESIFYSIGFLDVEEGEMKNVVIDKMKGGIPLFQLQAEKALWNGEKWILKNGIERFFDKTGQKISTQIPFEEKEAPVKESPKDLIPKEPDPETMSYHQLKKHIRRLKILGIPTKKQEIDLQLKLAFPWTNLIVLLIGIPFAFHKTGGKVKAIGFSLIVAFFYFGLLQVGRALGQKVWCPVILSAWLGNIIFLIIGGILFLRMRRLS